MLNTRVSALLRSYPGLTSFDTDLITIGTERDNKTPKIRVKSAVGDVLESLSQVIQVALVGLVDDYFIGAVADHLEANRLAQRMLLSEADLAEYDRLVKSWMQAYAAAGGKFNACPHLLPIS